MTVGLFTAGNASAAAEFGNNCIADRAESMQTYALVQLTQAGPVPTAPVSGVVTMWKIQLTPVPFSVPQQLKVFRPTANPILFQVVGESAIQNLSSGQNVFPTRIPIQAGDRIGTFGSGGFGGLWCGESPEDKNPANTIGEIVGNPTPGTTATVSKSIPEGLVPGVAVIEPDADHDGFGDETQDGCPQSAAFQSACPTITLDSVSLAGKSKATVLVTSNNQAPVSVTGTVKLGKGKTAKLKAAPKTVTPGTITSFSLKFSKNLKAALKALPPSRKLTLKITASATDVIGRVSTDKSALKLKGQG